MIKYLILVALLLISCFDPKSKETAISNEKTVYETGQQITETIFKEVVFIGKSDYESEIKTLSIQYQPIHLTIKYLDERAYIQVQNQSKKDAKWHLVNINFFYDNSYESAEKDIHLLINRNYKDRGYVLFPSFTEQFATYAAYKFEKASIIYLGEYGTESFDKGLFCFDEKTEKLYIEVNDKLQELELLTKIDSGDSEQIIKNDIQTLLKDEKSYTEKYKEVNSSKISSHWYGSYEGAFLRIKEESADPRAWASMSINISKDSTVFKLFSYIEEEDYSLIPIEKSKNIIDLVQQDLVENNANGQLNLGTIIYKDKEYFLQSPHLDSLIGETNKKLYKLKKE
ncbi:hypothetical protein [Aquimarina sp. AD1]|uniref:hypothetical protein n=1 Tax=Aquimarina sp. (strain AD1) TaxID=1714848 RepID=UPI0011C35A2F|nr:hypothetical protein [Aquimarina sp. AD1]